MPHHHADRGCCGRCAGRRAGARSALRSYYKAAIFPAPPQAPVEAVPQPAPAAGGPRAAPRPLPGVVCGEAVDASPQVLVMSTPEGERTLTLVPGTSAWRGRAIEPTDIRAGDRVVVRVLPGAGDVADRVWAAIGRVTGTIVERDGNHLLVDEGATRQRQLVCVPPTSRSRILVRFPQLDPGQLIDVIGVRRGDRLEAVQPATAQSPAPPPGRGPRLSVPAPPGGALRGAATWHEPAIPHEEPEGLAYPAVDPASGCAEAASADPGPAPALPYLAVGSILTVRNDCAGMADTMPVTTCGALAGLFADRCLTCGTSRRARIADLTMASFVRVGGELEQGCFNATLAIGWRP